MDIDPRQASAFQAVLDTGSFEQAATRLHVTPSAVTQRVRQLEASLGMPLLLRTRPCRATRAGHQLRRYLRRSAVLRADFFSEFTNVRSSPTPVAIALNSDSLKTWFMASLQEILALDKHFVIELIVEDQDHTFALLEGGAAIGCITTEATPMRGCIATPLGGMRYRLLATQSFARQWFPDGLNRIAARDAPIVAYSRRDTLQSAFLLERFGLPETAYPRHIVPGADSHFAAIRCGLGYGMVPETLCVAVDSPLEDLVDLAPGYTTCVDLYWHTWEVQSPSMATLSKCIVQAARGGL
jgi:LysR family transcriptional regulator, chromosome initiation inhibitor